MSQTLELEPPPQAVPQVDIGPVVERPVDPRLAQLHHDFLQCPPTDVEHFSLREGIGGTIVPLGSPVTNEDLVNMDIAENPEKVRTLTGFTRRFWRKDVVLQQPGETEAEFRRRLTDELLVPAGELTARETLYAVGKRPEEVDILVVLSTSGASNLAETIRGRAGLVNVRDENLFSVAMTCSSGAAGLAVAGKYPSEARKLIITPEVLTVLVDRTDRNIVLFSDVASGLYADSGAYRVGNSSHHIFPDKAHALQIYPFYDWPEGWDSNQVIVETPSELRTFYPRPADGRRFQMDGHEVYEWSVGEVSAHILHHADEYGIDLNNVRVIPHQANGRIVSGIEKRVKKKYLGAQVLFTNGDLGNNSAASTIGALLRARERGMIEPTEPDEKTAHVVAASFGGGLVSWVTDFYIPA